MPTHADPWNQIEGFKLHVSHITKPFTGRIRYAPEVASKPDRLAKDLANAKTLATILEAEYDNLRKMKIEPKPETNGNGADANGAPEQPDASMANAEAEAEDDSEPAERGSEAVERRIEKVMADLREQNAVDFSDEKAVEARRVRGHALLQRAALLTSPQTVVALDLYLAYLRSAFNTCYYCAVVTDHVEELQRKCVKHVRKPLSKSLLQEIKAAEAQKAEKDVKTEGESVEEKEKEKETSTKEKSESRDWKRNGTSLKLRSSCFWLLNIH